MGQGFQILFYFCPECSPSKKNSLFSRICRNPLYEIILVANKSGLATMTIRDTSKETLQILGNAPCCSLCINFAGVNLWMAEFNTFKFLCKGVTWQLKLLSIIILQWQFTTRAKQLNLLTKCFTRKLIFCQLCIFYPINCARKSLQVKRWNAKARPRGHSMSSHPMG